MPDGSTFGSFKPIYAPISKIDDEQKMVFGWASTDTRDLQGEVITRAAISNALPGYMQFGNIREMHQPSAVGVAQEATMTDKGLWLGAKIYDDRAWQKVKAGVYKGFSIGGRVTERDSDDRSVIKGLELTEISLVDRPANPDALFEIIKRVDGALIYRAGLIQKWDCGMPDHQHTAKKDAEECVTKRLNDAMGSLGTNDDFYYKRDYSQSQRDEMAGHEAMADGSFPIKTAKDVENAVRDWGRAGSKPSVKAHIIARAKAIGATDKLPKDWEGSTKKEADPEVEKRTQLHQDDGKFVTHANASAQSKAKADYHAGEAAKARKEEARHRGRADKAKLAADTHAMSIHEHLASEAASLASAHERQAENYRNLADSHAASASKTTQAEESKMARTLTEAETAAKEAVEKLAALVNGQVEKTETDVKADLEDARKSAMDHTQAASDHEVEAAIARGKVAKSAEADEIKVLKGEANQNDLTAKHHHNLAMGFHELAAFTVEKAIAGTKDEAVLKDLHTIATEHTGHLTALSQNMGMFSATHAALAKACTDDESLKTHHTDMAKAYGETRDKLIALAARFEAVTKASKDTKQCANCGTYMAKDAEKCPQCGAEGGMKKSKDGKDEENDSDEDDASKSKASKAKDGKDEENDGDEDDAEKRKSKPKSDKEQDKQDGHDDHPNDGDGDEDDMAGKSDKAGTKDNKTEKSDKSDEAEKAIAALDKLTATVIALTKDVAGLRKAHKEKDAQIEMLKGQVQALSKTPNQAKSKAGQLPGVVSKGDDRENNTVDETKGIKTDSVAKALEAEPGADRQRALVEKAYYVPNK